MRLFLMTAISFLSIFSVKASAIEMYLTGKVISVEDARSRSQIVSKGGAASAKLSVRMLSRGSSRAEIQKWISQNLPRSVSGEMEVKHQASGQVIQALPVSFYTNAKVARCKASTDGIGEVCEINFSNRNNNWAQFPAKTAGYFALNLKLKEPQSDTPIVTNSGPDVEFMVEGNSSRSFASFAGLPEN